MPALTDSEPSTTAARSSLASVPTAVWAAVGTLAIATAGLAGALVMRSVNKEAPAAPAVQTSAAPRFAPDDGIAPVQAAAHPAQPSPQAAPAAPHPAKPVHRVQEQHASAGPVAQAQPRQPEATRAVACSTCGTVESVREFQEKGEGSGLGVAGGAVAGGLLGHQVGGGNGKTAMTVIGAIGGALAGNEVEKRVRATTAYDVQVRMEDGSVRSIRRAEPIATGTRVIVEGSSIRVPGGAAVTEPRTLRTSVTGNGA